MLLYLGDDGRYVNVVHAGQGTVHRNYNFGGTSGQRTFHIIETVYGIHCCLDLLGKHSQQIQVLALDFNYQRSVLGTHHGTQGVVILCE